MRRSSAAGMLLCAMTVTSAAHAYNEREFNFVEFSCDLFTPSRAYSINDHGVVVGSRRICDSGLVETFVYSESDGAFELQRPPGISSVEPGDINDRGLITGTLLTELGHLAFIWDGEFTTLPFGPDGTYSNGAAINASGVVAGTWGNQATGEPFAAQACIWRDGELININPALDYSVGLDISDTGVVGGRFFNDERVAHGFLWEDGVFRDLGPIPGGFLGSVEAVNNHGHAVMWGLIESDSGPLKRSAYWNGEQLIDLGLPKQMPEIISVRATDLNDAGEVIGWVESSNETFGFMWRDGVFDITTEPVWYDEHITEHWAINAIGQIAGSATSQWIISSPIGKQGDLNCDDLVDVNDLLILLSQWGACSHCAADFDGSFDVGMGDLLFLLATWSD